jgi:hypothetical protein
MTRKELLEQCCELKREEIKQALREEIKKYTNNPFNLTLNICTYYTTPKLTSTINFIDENGKKDFWSELVFKYENENFEIIQLHLGSIAKDTPYKLECIKVASGLLQNIEELEIKLFNLTQTTCFEELDNILTEEREERLKKEREELKQKQDNVLENMKPGDIYLRTFDYNKTLMYKIVKITPKRIYFNKKDGWKKEENIEWEKWWSFDIYEEKLAFVNLIIKGKLVKQED